MAETTNINAVEVTLRRVVSPKMQNYVTSKAKTWNRISEGRAEKINSRGAEIIVKVHPNASNAGFGEGGAYAQSGRTTRIAMKLGFARWSKSRFYTEDAYEEASASDLALVDTVIEDTADDMDAMKRELNRQCWGNGDGSVGTVAASGVDQPNSKLTMASPDGAYFVLEGGEFYLVGPNDAIRVNGGSSPYKMICTAVDDTTQIVTFDDVPSDAAAGDKLVWFDSLNRAIHGMDYHINNDNGLYQARDRSAFRNRLKARVVNANVSSVDQPLSLAFMDRLDGTRFFVTDDETEDFEWACSPAQELAYIRIGDSLQRVVKDGMEKLDLSTKLNGKGVTHRYGWFIDRDIRDNRLYHMKWSTFGRWWKKKPGFFENPGTNSYWREGLTVDGATIRRTDQRGYIMGFKGNIGCYNPNLNGVIINLSTLNLPTKMAPRG